MAFSFLPKELNFFDLFDKQVDCAVKASDAFKALSKNGNLDDDILRKIHDIEHEGDETTHIILDSLNKTFITPFDREDIHALAKEIDDIIDMIYTITNRLNVYKLPPDDKRLSRFVPIIEESIRAVSCAVKGLRNLKHRELVITSCVEVNRLENIGDSMRDEALADLFDNEKDPVFIIKWKEIYQDAETVLDICEDVAHVVQSILVKQA